MTSIWIIIFICAISSLLYIRASLSVFTLGIGCILVFFSVFYPATLTTKIILSTCWLIMLLFNCRFLRRNLITKFIFSFYKKVMPKVSITEKIALEAGDIWWEAELFKGKPDWHHFLNIPKLHLSDEEQAFIDGPTEELCNQANDWKIRHEDADMSPDLWKFIKTNGFFGLVIPKRYGGKEFSPYAHAVILTKIYTRSITVAVSVGVPNSLGPAELLLHYGTEEQKNYYLPRLACGEEVPCFALTSPHAGSDATAMTDYGIVCRGEFEGKTVLGMRLTWSKRYITLCPVATVLGLAFKLFDPDHLLGEKEDIGITCALIPMNTPGISRGRRHFPAGAVFQNGPTSAKDLFVPLSYIIGGSPMAGHGWRMLVECLSVGRAISLPASGVACAKMVPLASGAYAHIREQFGMPIGYLEGIEEALAQIGGTAYQTVSLSDLTLMGIQAGYKPSICSAISKYHCTERSRKILAHAMDIHAGKGVMIGPKNYLAAVYQEALIGVTVEGANILTRNMIIFGQGAFRCHPYAHTEWKAATLEYREGLKMFDSAIFGHLGFTFSNFIRAFILGLTNGLLVFTPKSKTKRHFQRLTRYSANLALCADISMLALGGALKRKERLSARLGDLLSDLFISSSILKRYWDEGSSDEDKPLMEWAYQDLCYHIETTLDDLFKNYPKKWLAVILRFFCFPLGMHAKKPSDHLDQQVASLLMSPNSARQRLAKYSYVGHTENKENMLALNEEALQHIIAVKELEKKIRTLAKTGELHAKYKLEQIVEAQQKAMISIEEAEQLMKADQLRQAVLAVDDFSTEEMRHK